MTTTAGRRYAEQLERPVPDFPARNGGDEQEDEEVGEGESDANKKARGYKSEYPEDGGGEDERQEGIGAAEEEERKLGKVMSRYAGPGAWPGSSSPAA